MRMRRCVVTAVTLSLLLFLSSLWLPQATVQSCKQSWRPCLSVNREVVQAAVTDDALGGNDIITECAGQQFQVSRLLQHLNSALGPASDVLLEPYLLCWEELIKFMESLGPLVGFFTHKVEEKITLIRQLSLEDSKIATTDDAQRVAPPPHRSHAYYSVRSMLEAELQRGLVSFDSQTPSGSRTLLRLHRSLLWLQLLLDKLVTEREGRSMGELCRDAYLEVLAPHHPWLVQRAAELVFHAMPDRKVFLQLVCVQTQEEAEPVIHVVVAAIQEIHQRTQRELEMRNMLDLP
ncbi:ceramide-1-phosphate transfer protein [Pimephales promelas]|uniref:ceramide-1-phosphate transfer protein n=1 Tax=Pimephales promelas TaxID=90988 RepID=UPI001955B341|nr:ceramide-1-phosphate transfer protein [Pimephales promelas]XP_039516783.1 ceramide-1-phosphate transfer protein [Pimephales promelas]